MSKLHEQLTRILETLSLPEHYLAETERIARKRYTEQLEMMEAHSQELNKDLKQLLNNLDSVEEKFIKEQISSETFNKWRDKYTDAIDKKKVQLNGIGGNIEAKWSAFETSLPHLADLRKIYAKASVPLKQQFLNTVFDSGLWYLNGSYRTPNVHNVFAAQAATAVSLGLLVIEKKATENDSVASGRAYGNHPLTVKRWLSNHFTKDILTRSLIGLSESAVDVV